MYDVVLLLLACVEYEVKGAPAPPDIQLSADTVGIDGVCGSERAGLDVSNTGEADLTVSALHVEGWRWDPVALPVTLGAGETLRVPLHASAGTGTLTVVSDDPDERVLVVPLSATADTTPVAYITAPAEDDVLDPAAEFVLEAVVADEEDPPEELVVTWISDLTGTVATDTPDGDGHVATPWPAETRASGPQVMQILVEDPCGNVGENSLFFCQDGPWAIDSLTTNAWHVEGDASVDQDAARATLGPDAGSAFDVFSVFEADRVDASFQVDGAGAGLSFTLLDTDRVDTYTWLGDGGCGLGLGACGGGSGLPGLSFVFDTLAGDGNDCGSPPTLAVVVDGDLATPLACVPAVLGAVTVSIAAPRVTVTVEGTLVLDADLSTGAFPAFAGFTGVGDWTVNDLIYVDHTCR